MPVPEQEGASTSESPGRREIEPVVATSVVSPLSVAGLSIGQTVVLGREGARYEIVRALGKGGMASVVLARCSGAGGLVREVALKCLAPEMELDEAMRRAFIHEAQLAIRLRHPNIVEAYDFVEAGDRYFLVLEYVEGVSLKTVLQAARDARKKLSTGFCCHVAASIAEALHYAHGRLDAAGQPLGIVHRDVTPANVMIAESGAVKLFDFGIALARIDGRDQTRTGNLKGTYAYLSPEQASRGPVDGRSDLFSLGLVFVELLTGRRTFIGADEIDTVQKVARCAASDIAAAIEAVPEGLHDVCRKVLAKNPEERFHRGAELSRAIREYLLDEGVSYWTSDCVAEMRALRVFGSPASVDARVSDPTTKRCPTDVVSEPDESVEQGAADSRRASERRRPTPRRLLLGILLAVATVAGTLVALRSGGGALVPVEPAHLAVATAQGLNTGTPAQLAPDPGEPAGAPEVAKTEQPPVFSSSNPIAEAVVRPKRKRAATRPSRGLPDDEATRSSAPDVARAPTANGTLPRGTLVRAKLAKPLDPAQAASVEAVVAESVVTAGGVLVPAGSTLVCSSRVTNDGRVPLSCDAIRAPDRSWSFSGIAVGEGQHFGLRVVDKAVPAGSSFVVYVDAEFR